MEQKKKILVLGGGTGGLIAANLLSKHKEYEVTLIDKSDIHLFQPGMLWIGFKGEKPEKYAKPISTLIRKNVTFINDLVKEIDLENRTILLGTKRTLPYDILIIALGSHLDYDSTSGHRELVEKYGDFYGGIKNAEKLWKNFSQLSNGTLVIGAADATYKCPPAPHKAAFLAMDTIVNRGLKEKIRVKLALPFVHEYASERIADIVGEKLREKGIETITMFTVESVSLEEKKLYSLEGEEMEFDIATIIPIHKGPQVNVNPQEVRDEDGYFKVDKYKLNVNGYDDVYAIGDCNNTPTSKTGVTAHLGAEVVVERIIGFDSRFTGRTNCPIVSDGEATFVISDYQTPPVRVRFSHTKRMLEDFFIASYWSSLKEPEKWSSLFHLYFKATEPSKLVELGW